MSLQSQGPRLPAWIISGKLWYAVTACILLVLSFTGMLLLIPDTHNISEMLGEMAFWGFKVTVQTFIGLFQLAIVLVAISIIFDPLTIRRELMALLMDWYEQMQARHQSQTSRSKNDSTDGLKLLAMAVISASTLIAASIILAALYRAAF